MNSAQTSFNFGSVWLFLAGGETGLLLFGCLLLATLCFLNAWASPDRVFG